MRFHKRIVPTVQLRWLHQLSHCVVKSQLTVTICQGFDFFSSYAQRGPITMRWREISAAVLYYLHNILHVSVTYITCKLVTLLCIHVPDGGDDVLVQGEKTAFACRGTQLHLQCSEPNEVIKVTRANYGRFSIAVCNDKSTTSWSVNCYSPRAKEVFVSK